MVRHPSCSFEFKGTHTSVARCLVSTSLRLLPGLRGSGPESDVRGRSGGLIPLHLSGISRFHFSCSALRIITPLSQFFLFPRLRD